MRKALGRILRRRSMQSEPPASRQLITRELLAQCERLGSDPSSSHIYRFDEKTVIKFGDGVRMAEAAAMRLVREKTSIPVPEVYDAYIQDESSQGCIVMEYVEGKPLDNVWSSLDETQKDEIITQLKRYLDELRNITGSFIGSVDRTYCEDQFFGDDPISYGPFDSEATFRQGLIRALRERGQNSWTEMVVRFISSMPQHHRIVLTHNDLAPRNILVCEAKVVAIVDWELSGFFPEYWEYIKAYFWPDWQSAWVKDGILDRILDAYTLELGYLLHARDIIW